MIKSFLIFWIILNSCSSLLQANNSIEDQYLIDILNRNSSYCVQSYEEDKIFINPANIIVAEKGIFLDLNGYDTCPLPLLQSNKSGYFLQTGESQNIRCYRYENVTCPNCDMEVDKKGRCQNPECFFYEMKVE